MEGRRASHGTRDARTTGAERAGGRNRRPLRREEVGAGAFAQGKNTPLTDQQFIRAALAHQLNVTVPNSTLPMLDTHLALAQKDLKAVSH